MRQKSLIYCQKKRNWLTCYMIIHPTKRTKKDLRDIGEELTWQKE